MTAILLTDGYKLGHRQQYPEGTTEVYSNFTARSSRTNEDHVVFFGLQAFLQRWLGEEFDKFFAYNVDEVCEEYTARVNGYLGPNNVGNDHVRDLHALGYVSLEFRALPEGTRVPVQVPMLTVRNTHPDFFWLVNYIETLLSTELWLPCTTATTTAAYRRLFDRYAALTGTDPLFVGFQGHDFSMRGLSGVAAASMSGAAHLLSSVGTDTLPALDWIDRYYPVQPRDEFYMIGASVNATEHSVMSAGTAEVDEEATFRRLLLDVYPEGILSVVSDTFNLWDVLTDILPSLRDEILARDGKLVIRPDSGDPVKILCGDWNAMPGSPERNGVIRILWETFGGTLTETGYKLLDEHVGAIYGDAITLDRAKKILDRLAKQGFASGNVVFGIGSYTYQHVTRDTYGFVMKATSCIVNGTRYPLYKDPVTGSVKKSARGLLAVRMVDGVLTLFEDQDRLGETDTELKIVWKDGKFVTRVGFDEVRARLGLQV